MMKQRILFLTAITLSSLLLASCEDRAAEDTKLATACVAGLQAMYDPEDVIEIKQTSFLSEKSSENTNLRTVKIHAYYTHNHGTTEEKDYLCSFEEGSSLLGFNPRFYHMDRDGMRYGNFDGVVDTNLSDIMKINQAVAPLLK